MGPPVNVFGELRFPPGRVGRWLERRLSPGARRAGAGKNGGPATIAGLLEGLGRPGRGGDRGLEIAVRGAAVELRGRLPAAGYASRRASLQRALEAAAALGAVGEVDLVGAAGEGPGERIALRRRAAKVAPLEGAAVAGPPTRPPVASRITAAYAALVADLAHDVSNSLAVVTGNAQLLLAAGVDDGVRERLQLIHRHARRCVDLLRAVPTLQAPPSRDPLALESALRRAADLLGGHARQRGVAVVVTAPAFVAGWSPPHVPIALIDAALLALAVAVVDTSPRGATVTLGAAAGDHGLELSVATSAGADAAPGSPEGGPPDGDALDHAREMLGFYRGELRSDAAPAGGRRVRIRLPASARPTPR